MYNVKMFFDNLADTINGFVCIRVVGIHSFLCHGSPISNCIFCIQSNLEFKLNTLGSLSRYNFNIKTAHICLKYVDQIS